MTLSPESYDDLLALADLAVTMFRDILESKGNNASRRLTNSLKSDLIENGVNVITTDAKYWKFVNMGYRPATAADKRGRLYGAILQWSKDKGISFATETERKTFAYFVAKKIDEGGYMQNRQGAARFRDDVLRSPEFKVMESRIMTRIVARETTLNLNKAISAYKTELA